MKSFYKIIALLCLLPGVCFGQGAHRIGQVLSRGSGVSANVVPYASILVCPAGTNCNTTSPLYSNITLTVTALNPVIADSNGVYGYYATPACYDEHISAPGVTAYTVFNVCSVSGSSSGIVLQADGTSLPQQNLLNFNSSTPTPPAGNTNVTFQYDSIGDLSGYVPTSSGGGCTGSTCFIFSPAASQIGTQPAGTTAEFNNFANQWYANLFGNGSNGIETVYNNAASCIPQGNGISDGCTIQVPPLYTNADAPQGWKWQGNYYGGSVNGLLAPSGTSAYDYRNGTLGLYYRDPSNPLGGQSGLSSRTDITQNLGTRTYIAGGSYDPTGINISTNQYAGGWDFQYNLYMPQYVGQNYEFGLNLAMENWSDGISFAQQNILRCHGMGDCLGNYMQVTADGGILAGNSEGTELGDFLVQEDPVDFYGVIHAVSPTSISIGCQQGCGTEGQDRLIIDYSSTAAIVGTVATGEVGPRPQARRRIRPSCPRRYSTLPRHFRFPPCFSCAMLAQTTEPAERRDVRLDRSPSE
jgi:hypothetical protein